MTTYIPDLADEVLVTYGPHRGGVGTVTDIETDPVTAGVRYKVEGTRTDGDEFTRWFPDTACDLTPARWGTWRIQVTTIADPNAPIISVDITDHPIEPLEMILDGMRDVPWFIVEGRQGRTAVATAHVETVEVLVTARRDHR